MTKDLAVKAECFETPVWAADAILKVERPNAMIIDPCCGRGVLSDACVRWMWADQDGGKIMNRFEILEAAKAAMSERATRDGDPEDIFAAIAARWNLTARDILSTKTAITPTMVALMMIDLKMERALNNPGHADNWVDIAGYAACGGGILKKATELWAPRQRLTP